jgi:zinc protease
LQLEDSVVRQFKAFVTAFSFLLLTPFTLLAHARTEASGNDSQGSTQISIPSVKRDLLLNELQLLVLPQSGTGSVSVHLRINSGAMFDLAGKGGLADFTAGMLLRSAKGLPAKDLSEFLNQSGLTLNLRVGWDSTNITISGPAALLESILDLLGRLVVNPNFEQPELDAFKAARIKELSAEKPDHLELARETALETLYGRYPLGRPVHGTADSVSKINRSDVVYYHNRFYLANAAELAVAGDVTPEEVTKLARAKLGIWKKGEKVPATFLPPEPLTSRKIVLVDRPQSFDSTVVMASQGISRRASDYLATAVMLRLFETLSARSISGAKTMLEARYLPGPLLVAFDSTPDKAAAALQGILDGIEHLKSADIPQADLEAAKQSLIASYAQDTATTAGQIAALFDIEQYGLGRDYMLNFEARVGATSSDEIKAAAKKHLDAMAVAISAVGPAAVLSDPLKKLGPVSVVGSRQTF